MQYFVTGATGFIGKRLVKKLLERKGSVVYFLIRKESEGKVAALREYWAASAARVVPVFGDLTTKKLGVSGDDVGHPLDLPHVDLLMMLQAHLLGSLVEADASAE